MSDDPGTQSTQGTAMRARTLRVSIAVAIIAAASAAAYLQPSPADPNRAVRPFSLAHLVRPVEHNRLIQAGAETDSFAEAKLFATPGLETVWMAARNFVAVSRDFGDTWQPSNLPTGIGDGSTRFELGGLAATDAQNLTAVGGPGHVIVTSDNGGQAWRTVFDIADAADATAPHPQHLSAVALSASGEYGMAAGTLGALVVRHADGRWRLNHKGATRSRAEAVAISDSGQVMLISTDRGTLWSTVDGGETWAAVSQADVRAGAAVTLSADGRRGLALLRGTAIARLERVPESPPAAGAEATMATPTGSSASGFAVRLVAPYDRLTPTALDMTAEGTVGYAVGSIIDNNRPVGAILRTVDGGVAWQALTLDVPVAPLVAVRLADDGKTALTLGDDGTVLRTSNGGETWDRVAIYRRAPALWYFVMLVVAFIVIRPAIRPHDRVEHGTKIGQYYDSDNPIERPADDRLNFMADVEVTSEFLRNPRTKPPLSLAITGDWGSGKTSFMRLLVNDLAGHGVRTVWFNAWHYQSEENLLAALLEVIRRDGLQRWWSPEGIVVRARLLLIRAQQFATGGSIAVLIALVFFLAALLLVFDDRASSIVLRWILSSYDVPVQMTDQLKQALSGVTGNLVILVIVLGLTSAIYSRLRVFGLNTSRMFRRRQEIRRHLGFRYRFGREFSQVTNALPFPMVIVIDDLDRCSRTNLVELLEGINFLMSTGNCFIIFGMDTRLVVSALQAELDQQLHGDGGGADATDTGAADPATVDEIQAAGADPTTGKDPHSLARNYLEKLINIEIPVPEVTTAQVPDFFRSGGAKRPAPARASVLDRLKTLAMAMFVILLLGSLSLSLALAVGEVLSGAVKRTDELWRILHPQAVATAEDTGAADTAEPAPTPDPDPGATTQAAARPAEPDTQTPVGDMPAARTGAPAPDEPPPVEPTAPAVIYTVPNVTDDRRLGLADRIAPTAPGFTRPDLADAGLAAPSRFSPPAAPGPDLVERVRAHVLWVLLPILVISFVVLLVVVSRRWRRSESRDSEEFASAIARWGRVLLNLEATPRNLKRFENRVRFLGLRQMSRTDAAQLPVSMLAALVTIYQEFPTWLRTDVFSEVFDATGALTGAAGRHANLARFGKLEPVLRQAFQDQAAEPGPDTGAPASWPASEQQRRRFAELARGLLVR